jgi:hypothetical protein
MPRSSASRKSFGALSAPSARAISRAYISLQALELKPPEPPAPPIFPTFLELVEQDRLPLPRSDRPKGLFEELLAARPEALYLHGLEHEGLYDDETAQLLHELVSNQRAFRSLTLKEQELLDRATFDFATARPRAPLKPPAKLAEPPKDDDEEEEKTAEETSPEQTPSPEEMSPYWWI